MIFNRYAATSGASKNSRIDTVCGNLGLNGRRVMADSNLVAVMDEDIDWTNVKEKTEVYRDRMWDYLRYALR